MLYKGIYITEGNSKLIGVPLFSLPIRKTCPQSTKLCRKYCYGNKSWTQYPNVRKTRNKNYTKSKQKSFVKNMEVMISKLKTVYFRLNETGDFYSQEYLDKWFEIIRAFPKIRFVVFSKSWDLNWSKMPSNVNRFWSVWPDSKNIPKSGRLAYTIHNSEEFNYPIRGDVYICPYPQKRCFNGCESCFSNNPPNHIAFRKH